MADNLDRDKVLAALDAGTLQMMRPHGDYVAVRSRRATKRGSGRSAIALVWMEGKVEGSITFDDERCGFRGFRIGGGA